MKPADLIEELRELLAEGQKRGAPRPSGELNSFIDSLSKQHVALTKPTKKSRAARPRSARPRKKPPERNVGNTIEELARKLKLSFDSANKFDAVLAEPETQSLSKPSVVLLYQRTFDTVGALSKSMTKPELFNAFRRERINRIRGRS